VLSCSASIDQSLKGRPTPLRLLCLQTLIFVVSLPRTAGCHPAMQHRAPSPEAGLDQLVALLYQLPEPDRVFLKIHTNTRC
jgi:hypothetical protein